MVPRARLCLLSPRCERRSLPQERNIPRPVPVLRPRRSGQYPRPRHCEAPKGAVAIRNPVLPQRAIFLPFCGFAVCLCFFVPLFRRLRRASSERTSLAPFPQNRDTAKTPYRSVAPPLQIETYRFDLRRTFRRNLPAATNRSCAVFRRIRTRNPSPTTKGAAAPIGFPRGLRRTRDEGRELGRG